jgi:hypothetical protein
MAAFCAQTVILRSAGRERRLLPRGRRREKVIGDPPAVVKEPT